MSDSAGSDQLTSGAGYPPVAAHLIYLKDFKEAFF